MLQIVGFKSSKVSKALNSMASDPEYDLYVVRLLSFHLSQKLLAVPSREVRFDHPDDALEALVRPDLGRFGGSKGGSPVVTMVVSILKWS